MAEDWTSKKTQGTNAYSPSPLRLRDSSLIPLPSGMEYLALSLYPVSKLVTNDAERQGRSGRNLVHWLRPLADRSSIKMGRDYH